MEEYNLSSHQVDPADGTQIFGTDSKHLNQLARFGGGVVILNYKQKDIVSRE